MVADELFARYSIAQPLDPAGVDVIREAILAPRSPSLARLLAGAAASGQREYYRGEEFRAARQEGLAADEAGFRSEALERMVLAHGIADRLDARSGPGKQFWYLAQACEWAAKAFQPLDLDWDMEAIERLVRARVHASETIGASNSLIHYWQRYDPVPLLAAAPPPDAAARERLAFQLRRLERSEQRSSEAGERRAFFSRQDVALLEALSRASGQPSPVFARLEAARNLARAERGRLVESVSPSWRDLFDALFDLVHPRGHSGPRDAAEQAVLDLPAFAALASVDGRTRGTILSEAAVMHEHLDRIRRGNIALPPGVVADDGPGGIGHPAAAGLLAALVSLLIRKRFDCDDAAMAALIERAQNWRPLCRPALLDAAERALARGPAPATEQALRGLAERPSHCFVPSRKGGPFEGDGWWQDTPGRVAAMLADRPLRPPPPPQSAPPAPPAARFGGVGRALFGRKRI